MVKTLQFERIYNCSVSVFFGECFGNSAFATTLHKSLGDTDIDCSDWITTSATSAQRLLFFSKQDNGESTRCIETQSYKQQVDGSYQIKIMVNPENPLGQVFRIEANWTLRRHPDEESTDPSKAGCRVEICLEIECKKRLWGGYGNSMVEGMLEKSARREYEAWLNEAERHLSAAGMGSSGASAGDNSNDTSGAADVVLNVASGAKSAALFDRHQVRAKVSSVGHTVVRGTERFVSALLEHGGVREGEERPVILVPVSGGQLPTIFSAPSSGRPRRRPLLYRRPVILILFMVLLLGAAFLWHLHFPIW